MSEQIINKRPTVVGGLYRITFKDCCVNGDIHGRFLGYFPDKEDGEGEDERYGDYRFDIGVIGPATGAWTVELVTEETAKVHPGFTREDVEALRFEGNDLTAWASDAESEEARARMIKHGFLFLSLADRIEALLPPEEK